MMMLALGTVGDRGNKRAQWKKVAVAHCHILNRYYNLFIGKHIRRKTHQIKIWSETDESHIRTAINIVQLSVASGKTKQCSRS